MRTLVDWINIDYTFYVLHNAFNTRLMINAAVNETKGAHQNQQITKV